jgi:two-component system response regulator HydG
MKTNSLAFKFLVLVCTVVLLSGSLIALIVTKYFGENLYRAIVEQSQNLAHAIALESTEKVFVNDRVALQKMLDHQIRSNKSIAYLFVSKDGKILAHTFQKGIPVELIDANKARSETNGNVENIVSTTGVGFIDVAWPIFEGKAGELRLGISKEQFNNEMRRLWLMIGIITMGVLVCSIAASLIFVRRITRPISALVEATGRMNSGDFSVTVDVVGKDEVAVLSASFNKMVEKLQEFTNTLEFKAKELERSHNQTRTFCEIIREIGALETLDKVGPALIRRLSSILTCKKLVFVLLSSEKQTVFHVSESTVKFFTDTNTYAATKRMFEKTEGLVPTNFAKEPFFPGNLAAFSKFMLIPFRFEGEPIGALMTGCNVNCACNLKDMELAGLILSQAAGSVKRAIAHEILINEIKSKTNTISDYCGIIGKDPKMHAIFALIDDVAVTDATVLIQGESGTGKELVAQAIHEKSSRKGKPFIIINCSAYPDTLLESELFGHTKGAFTGAVRQRAGRFQEADGGTIFLDEIGEIGHQAQLKLLRAIQSQSFERLGSNEIIRVDVRIVAATNKDLAKEVENGLFREDLYYRLNVIPIYMPPLRERANDIPAIARHFLKTFSEEQAKSIIDFSSEAMRLLINYAWPGNVRELQNTIEHAVVLAKGNRIEASDLPTAVRGGSGHSIAVRDVHLIEENEKALLERVLYECSWNKKLAAHKLGIGRTTLYSKMKRYKIEKQTLQ